MIGRGLVLLSVAVLVVLVAGFLLGRGPSAAYVVPGVLVGAVGAVLALLGTRDLENAERELDVIRRDLDGQEELHAKRVGRAFAYPHEDVLEILRTGRSS